MRRPIGSGIAALAATLAFAAPPAFATETIGSSQAGDSTQAGPCGQATCVLFQDTAPNGSVISPSASGQVTDITIKKTAGALNIQPVVISPTGQVAEYTLESIGATIALDPAAGNMTYPLTTPLAIDPGDTVGIRYPDGPAPADPKLYNNDPANGGSMTRIGNTAAGPGRASTRAYPFSARFANYNMNFKFTVTTPTPDKVVDLAVDQTVPGVAGYTRSSGTPVSILGQGALGDDAVMTTIFRDLGPSSTTYSGTAKFPPQITIGAFAGPSDCVVGGGPPHTGTCSGPIDPGADVFFQMQRLGFAGSTPKNPFVGMTGEIVSEIVNTDPTVTEENLSNNVKREAIAVVRTPHAIIEKDAQKKANKVVDDRNRKIELNGISRAADDPLGSDAGDDRRGEPVTSEDEAGVDAALRITGVEVALARKAKGGCDWLTGGDGDRAISPCDEPAFEKGKGKRKWSYTRKGRLRDGDYILNVRPTTASGATDSEFSKKDGDELRFEVK